MARGNQKDLVWEKGVKRNLEVQKAAKNRDFEERRFNEADINHEKQKELRRRR